MTNALPFFTESLDLREHPISKTKAKTKLEYCQALSYIVKTTLETLLQDAAEETTVFGKNIPVQILKKYVYQRLVLYYKQFQVDEKECLSDTESQKAKLLHSFSVCTKFPWRHKQRYWLLCDAALILLDRALIEKACDIEKTHLNKRAKVNLEMFGNSLFDSNALNKRFSFAACLANQYRANNVFYQAIPKKLIVTANMSAGKSTLINALIGKPIARTSQEACTGNVCYLYNKAFEDNHIALASPEVNLTATNGDLNSYLWQDEITIASYFAGNSRTCFSICIIDTPGVNAALYKEQSEISHKALKEQNYDKLVYVISPTNLGTDAEIKHLKWIAENTSKEKVIFVLNKMDDFHSDTDDISESITDLRIDLLKLGFESPIICPLSAYFGFLLKMKSTNQELSEDESDDYTRLARKFSRPKHDLSGYYKDSQVNAADDEIVKLCKQSGLYGLEKIIYGGTV